MGPYKTNQGKNKEPKGLPRKELAATHPFYAALPSEAALASVVPVNV